MNEVEQRIVEMQFENKQFESNAAQSISTINKLDKSLDMADSTKGLSDLDRAIGKVDFSPMSSAISTVTSGLSAMEIAGIAAITNLTNSVIAQSKKMVSAFTIEPVKTGFSEYETQINSVQTILANTSKEGTTLTQVNAALDELNTYADKTIYNFTEMTRNIGTFTAAGVELDTSVNAIKGIANVAAISGSTSQQASTAMYQLSQALATGKVQLMDWNSLVNAGMGGAVLQDALTETARVSGVAIDEMIAQNGSFRDSLQEDWLTSEILLDTLAKFTGDLSRAQLEQQGYTEEQIDAIVEMGEMANDAATKVKTFTQLIDTLKEAVQSGWSQSWRIIIGDFEEAKLLFTEISDVMSAIIGQTSDARNALLLDGLGSGLEKFLDLGVPDMLSDKYMSGITELAKQQDIDMDALIQEYGSFQEVLKTGVVPVELMSIALSDMTIQAAAASEAELEYNGLTAEDVEMLVAFNKEVQNGTVSMAEYYDLMMVPSGRDNLITSLRNLFEALLNVIEPVKEAFTEIFPAYTADNLYALTETIRDFTAGLQLSEESAAALKTVFLGVFSAVSNFVKICQILWGVLGIVYDHSISLRNAVMELVTAWAMWYRAFSDTFEVQTILEGIEPLVTNLVDAFGNLIAVFVRHATAPALETIYAALENIRGLIADLASPEYDMSKTFASMQDAGERAAAILDSIYITAKSLFAGFIDVCKGAGTALYEFFASIGLEEFLEIVKTGSFTAIAAALVSFVRNINNAMNTFLGIGKSSSQGVSTLRAMIEEVEDTFASLQQTLKSAALMEIAAAIGVLTVSLMVLSSIDQDKLSKALAGVASALLMLVTAYNLCTLNISKNSWSIGGQNIFSAIGDAVTILSLASAVTMLTVAIYALGYMDLERLGQGLTAVGLLLVLLTAFQAVATSAAPKLITLSIGLMAFAAACVVIGNIDFDVLGDGILRAMIMFSALSSFFIMMNTFAKDTVTKTCLSLISAAGAIYIFAQSILLLNGIPITQLVQSAAVLTIMLTAVEASMLILSRIPANNVIALCLELAALSATILIFTTSMLVLTQLDENKVLAVSFAISLMLLAFAGAANIANAAIVGMLGIAAVIVALTIQFLGFAQGMYILAQAALVFSGALAAVVASVLLLNEVENGFSGLFVFLSIVVDILDDVVEIARKLAPYIIQLGVGFLLLSASVVVLGTGLTLVASSMVAFAGAFTVVVGALLLASTQSQQIVDGLTTIANAIPSIVQTVGDSISQSIVTIVKTICTTASQCFVTIAATIDDLLLQLKLIVINNIKSFADDLIPAFVEMLESLQTRIPELAVSLAEFVISLIETAGELFEEYNPRVNEAMYGLAGDIVSGLIDGAFASLVAINEAYGKIVISIFESMKKAITNSGGEPETYEMGKTSGEGLADGLDDSTSKVKSAATNASDAVSGSIDASLPDMFNDYGTDIIGGLIDGVASGIPELQAVMDFVNSEVSQTAVTPVAEPILNNSIATTNSLLSDKEELAKQMAIAQGVYVEPEETPKALYTGLSGEVGSYAYIDSIPDAEDTYEAYADAESSYVDSTAETTEAVMDLLDEQYEHSMAWIDTEKEYERLGLADELAAYQRVMARYSEADKVSSESHIAQMESMREEVYRIEKEMSEAYKDFTDEETRITEEAYETRTQLAEDFVAQCTDAMEQAQQAQEERANTIFETFSLFDSPTDSEYVSGDSLIQSLQEQNYALETWQDDIRELSERNVFSDAMMEELQEMGPSVYREISALNAMTDSQLEDYASLWEEKLSLANDQALWEMGDTYSQIEAELEAFGEGLLSLSEETGKVIAVETKAFLEAYEESIGALDEATETELKELSEALQKQMTVLGEDAVAQTEEIQQNVTAVMAKSEDEWRELGASAAEGYTQGVLEKIPEIIQAVAEMIEAALDTGAEEQDSHSPSRLTYKLGTYFGTGYANGIEACKSSVEKVSSDMVNAGRTGLTTVLSTISDAMDTNLNLQPTIRPVLDLSDITTQTGQINSMFGQQQVSMIQNERSSAVEENTQTDTSGGNTPTYAFVQNNYSPKSLSAADIYRQTRNQFASMREVARA